MRIKSESRSPAGLKKALILTSAGMSCAEAPKARVPAQTAMIAVLTQDQLNETQGLTGRFSSQCRSRSEYEIALTSPSRFAIMLQ